MTTIAYKNGIVATDSQVSVGDTILTLQEDKCRQRPDGVTFWLCGSDTEIDEAIEAWPDGRVSEDNRAAGFATAAGALHGVACSDGRCMTWVHRQGVAWAYGTGAEFAIGAMDAGANAELAVNIAMKRDVYTGGYVNACESKTGEMV